MSSTTPSIGDVLAWLTAHVAEHNRRLFTRVDTKQITATEAETERRLGDAAVKCVGALTAVAAIGEASPDAPSAGAAEGATVPTMFVTVRGAGAVYSLCLDPPAMCDDATRRARAMDRIEAKVVEIARRTVERARSTNGDA